MTEGGFFLVLCWLLNLSATHYGDIATVTIHRGPAVDAKCLTSASFLEEIKFYMLLMLYKIIHYNPRNPCKQHLHLSACL